jgi:hypothetical protein
MTTCLMPTVHPGGVAKVGSAASSRGVGAVDLDGVVGHDLRVQAGARPLHPDCVVRLVVVVVSAPVEARVHDLGPVGEVEHGGAARVSGLDSVVGGGLATVRLVRAPEHVRGERIAVGARADRSHDRRGRARSALVHERVAEHQEVALHVHLHAQLGLGRRGRDRAEQKQAERTWSDQRS